MAGPAFPPRPESLGSAFATPESKHRYTRRLFATIADRYDLITRLLSFGRDQAWKRQLIELSGAGAGQDVLDLACGTGDLAFGAADRGARVVGLDFTARMIDLARLKQRDRRATARASSAGSVAVQWIVGDMGALPVEAARFDIVTTGYGLRNVPAIDRALAEIHRALRPGGLLCSLDFDRPEAAPVRAVYLGYLTCVGAALGWMLHRDPDTYRYIPASIRRYPGARGVVALMREAGFSDVRHVPLLGGFMALHIARKPATLNLR